MSVRRAHARTMGVVLTVSPHFIAIAAQVSVVSLKANPACPSHLSVAIVSVSSVASVSVCLSVCLLAWILAISWCFRACRLLLSYMMPFHDQSTNVFCSPFTHGQGLVTSHVPPDQGTYPAAERKNS